MAERELLLGCRGELVLILDHEPESLPGHAGAVLARVAEKAELAR